MFVGRELPRVVVDVLVYDPEQYEAVGAVIVTGANGLFSGGADVNDFNREMPPDAVTIRDVIGDIERSDKLFVAAIDGTCLGGGLEFAQTLSRLANNDNGRLTSRVLFNAAVRF